MGESTCVAMPCFSHSPEPPRDQGNHMGALTESVSFGRFMNETLDWDKWSTFSQNRYLEEAQRTSTRGLVAQKKAMLEAHFKKIAADRRPAVSLDAMSPDTGSEVAVHCARNEKLCGSPLACESGESTIRVSIDAAISDQVQAVFVGDSELQEAECNQTSGVCEIDPENISRLATLVRTDEPSCFILADTSQELNLCSPMEPPSYTIISSSMVEVDGSEQEIVFSRNSLGTCNSQDIMQTEAGDLNQNDFEDNSTVLLGVTKGNVAIPLSAHQVSRPSTGNKRSAVSPLKRLPSFRKPAFQSYAKPRPQTIPKKEDNEIQNTRAFGSDMVKSRRVILKSLHMSISLNSHAKEVKSSRIPMNSVKVSKELMDPMAVSASQKKPDPSSRALAFIRKSSADLYPKLSPSLIKTEKAITQGINVPMKGPLSIRKSTPISLRMSTNPTTMQRTEARTSAPTISMSKSRSNQVPAEELISSTSSRRKQPIPSSNPFVRKSLSQIHAKPTPPLGKREMSVIPSNSLPVLRQLDKKKSPPTSIHMSVSHDPSVGVRRRTKAQRTERSITPTPAVRMSGDTPDHLQASLRRSVQTIPVRALDDNRRPKASASLSRPPSPTVSTPFRFRSDERAATRKEKLELRTKIEAERFCCLSKVKAKEETGTTILCRSINFPVEQVISDSTDKNEELTSHHGQKLPPSRPQSPKFVRKPPSVKVLESTNYRPPHTPTTKCGSRQVPQNKIRTSTASITLPPRKITSENASPNIEI